MLSNNATLASISVYWWRIAGKSTLLKLMAGELTPTDGSISRRNGLVLGRYHQHSAEMLDNSVSAFDFFR